VIAPCTTTIRGFHYSVDFNDPRSTQVDNPIPRLPPPAPPARPESADHPVLPCSRAAAEVSGHRLTVAGVGPSSARKRSASGNVEAIWRCWRYTGAMPSVQVKNVPSETHAVLRQRAAAAHQSLQEYLRQRLIEEAAMPTVEEVLERAGGRAGGSVPFAEAVATLREDRDRR